MEELKADIQEALGPAYRVERELGGGGMSRVFVAEETALARKVVVKVLPPDMAAGVNAERFRREIQLAASLQHPHIVPLIAAGQKGDLVWYTMPLVEGESLREKIERDGRLPLPAVMKILRDVVDALAYAHSRCIVHRDIKPDNVLISHDHGQVTDFGVAKAVSQAATGATLTSAGLAIGTPAYMAPEQAAGDPNVDHRSDIYAAGLLAYEMLIGRPAFDGPSPHAVLAAQLTEPPAPIERSRPDVPRHLAAIIMRCLEKDVGRRWQSAAELRAALDGVATPVTPVSTPARPRSRAGLLAAIALLALAGTGAWLVAAKRGADRRALATAVAVFPFEVRGSPEVA